MRQDRPMNRRLLLGSGRVSIAALVVLLAGFTLFLPALAASVKAINL
jgi:hypothetical protein